MYMNKISIYQLKSVNVDVLVIIPFFAQGSQLCTKVPFYYCYFN